MRPRDAQLAARLDKGLTAFSRTRRRLPGISRADVRSVFVEQLLESIHRVRYVHRLFQVKLSANQADPNHPAFDPLKAAAWVPFFGKQ